MLGRTAASLFWMSRYMERAENVARLTEVGYRSALTPDSGGGHRGDWQSVLSAAGCLDGFEARGFPLTADAAREYLLFDRDNQSSVNLPPSPPPRLARRVCRKSSTGSASARRCSVARWSAPCCATKAIISARSAPISNAPTTPRAF